MQFPNQQLVEALDNCRAACNHCFHACLREREPDKMLNCIRLDRECADICSITSSYVSTQSTFTKAMLLLCAEVCDACAMECEMHSAMEHCEQCAKACRRCAELCRSAKA